MRKTSETQRGQAAPKPEPYPHPHSRGIRNRNLAATFSPYLNSYAQIQSHVRIAASVVWVAAWCAMAAWVVWTAHRAAQNPRKAALQAWCGERARYVQEVFSSSLGQAEAVAGLVKVFNGFGRNKTTLSYWGYDGCLSNFSWGSYGIKTEHAKRWMSVAWMAIIEHEDRHIVEESLGCKFLDTTGEVCPARPWYAVSFFLFNQRVSWPSCMDFLPRFQEEFGVIRWQGRHMGSRPYVFRSGKIGIGYGVPVFRHPFREDAPPNQKRTSVAGFIPAGFAAQDMIQDTLYNILTSGTDLYALEMFDSTDPPHLFPVYTERTLQFDAGVLLPPVQPMDPLPGHKVVDSFTLDTYYRRYEVHCRFRTSGSAWSLFVAPLLLGCLALLVAALLTVIIVVLARSRAQVRADTDKMQQCTATLARKERAKSESVASLSHELRTPIAGMLGLMDFLTENPLGSQQQHDLASARECVVGAMGLLNSVLDLAKLQAGRLQLERIPLSARTCLETAVWDLHKDTKHKDVECICHVDERVPDVLMGDPTRVTQVMGELISE